jgi:hypothetical protein
MDEALATLPSRLVVYALGAALLALQSLVLWRFRRTESGVENLTTAFNALDKRLEEKATKEALTNMGDRFQGLLAKEREDRFEAIAAVRERLVKLESRQ